MAILRFPHNSAPVAAAANLVFYSLHFLIRVSGSQRDRLLSFISSGLENVMESRQPSQILPGENII